MNIGTLPMYALNEAYFGKSPRCVEMEQCIHQMRQNIETYNTGFEKNTSALNVFNYVGGASVLGAKKDIYTSKPYKRFCQLLEQQFGFYSVSFIIQNDPTPNAMALLLTSNPIVALNASKYLHVSKQGFSYDKKAEYCIVILLNEGLLCDTYYTDAEVVAIMMHEIGHTFDAAVYPMMGMFNFMNLLELCYENVKAMNPTLSVSLPGEENKTKRNIIKGITFITPIRNTMMIHSKVTGTGFKWSIKSGFIKILEYIMLFQQIMFNLKNSGSIILFKLFGTSALQLINVIATIADFAKKIKNLTPAHYLISKAKDIFFGHAQEHFADRFATMHGYGPDLASALGKLDNNTKSGLLAGYVAKIPKLNLAQDVVGMAAVGVDTFVQMLFPNSRHPDYISRYNTMKNILKEDLNRPGVDIKAKKKIKQQLDEIDKRYKKYQQDAEKLGGAAKMNAKMNSIFGKIFPGSGDLVSFIAGKLGFNKNMNERIHAKQDQEKFSFKK